MRLIGLIITVLVISGCSNQPVFTVQDRAGLASYLSFNIVAHQQSVPDKKPDLKPGSICPECGGRGKQGDGTIEFPCKACNGTGKVLPKTSNIFTREINDGAVQLTWPPRQLPDYNITPTSKVETEVRQSALIKPIRRSNSHWSVGGKRSYTTQELVDHLKSDHKFDASGYERSDLEIIHDNLHDGFPALGK